MTDFVAWHNEPLVQHKSLRDRSMKEGYRFISLSVYGYTPFPFYAAIMIRSAPSCRETR
jgi:hypothetical protein